jgi:hypothetical protein
MRSSKNPVVAVVSALVLAFFLACTPDNEPCAQGPTELQDVELTAAAGQAIDWQINFGSDSSGVYQNVSTEGMPPGVALTLTDNGLHMGGSVATAGTYSFTILLEAEAGDACEPWARYDVELTVR